MHYHILEKIRRNGKEGYQLVQTYGAWQIMVNTVLDLNKPVWIITSLIDAIDPTTPELGGYPATRCDGGGQFLVDTMPLLPFFAKE